MKICPRCNLANIDTAAACDCGFPLVTDLDRKDNQTKSDTDAAQHSDGVCADVFGLTAINKRDSIMNMDAELEDLSKQLIEFNNSKGSKHKVLDKLPGISPSLRSYCNDITKARQTARAALISGLSVRQLIDDLDAQSYRDLVEKHMRELGDELPAIIAFHENLITPEERNAVSPILTDLTSQALDPNFWSADAGEFLSGVSGTLNDALFPTRTEEAGILNLFQLATLNLADRARVDEDFRCILLSPPPPRSPRSIKSGTITKMLSRAISDCDTGNISKRQLLTIFQDAIDNGDILADGNQMYVVAVVLPLVEAGVIQSSKHLEVFKSRMNDEPKYGAITKTLGIAINDCDAGHISKQDLLSIFQAAIDNGDILTEDNQLYVVAAVLPLVDSGLLRSSEHIKVFEARMDQKVISRVADIKALQASASKTTHWWQFARKKPSPRKLAEDLDLLLLQVALDKCKSFEQAWQRNIDGETLIAIFAELAVLLIAVADRLAFGKFGDPVRSQIMNPVIDMTRKCFANQKHFGRTAKERALRFERLFGDRFQKFASCSSIMDEGMDSLVFVGARHLAETFLDDLPDSELPEAIAKTGKVVSAAITALMTVPLFETLLEE